MIVAVSCCHCFVEGRGLPNARIFVVAELARNVQKHRLVGNIDDRQVYHIAAVSARPDSSDEVYDAFVHICRERSHERVSQALTYFISATLYKASHDEEF